MANIIKVSIKDKNTLVLEEDGKKGDFIDLTSVTSFDSSDLEKTIEEGKDSFYKKKLEEEKEHLKKTHETEMSALRLEIQNNTKDEINALNNKIKELTEQNKLNLANAKQAEIKNLSDLEKAKDEKIHELETSLSTLKSQLESEKKKYELEAENKYQKELAEKTLLISKMELTSKATEEGLKKDLENLKAQSEKEKTELENKYSKEVSDIKEETSKEKEALENQLREANRLRTTATIKVIGEDLETWCDREVTSYMQAGFLNCTWEKDNTVIKEDGETKGSKADYIFKIYADDTHQDLLTSVIMDMKSESLVSTNKKANKDHFQQLAKNREKKGCKYAVLVSELEMDKANDIPIYRVTDPSYPDMYVVRPQYLMTFLSMIASLTNKFASLILHVNKDNLQFQDKEKILEQLLSYKATYLDKPLDQMQKQVDAIAKQTTNIREASIKIDDAIRTIKMSYIDNITSKLDKYETFIKREVKKIPEE